MLRLRVLLTVLALLAVPFVASAAQGRGQEKVRPLNEESSCTPDQAAAVARARAAGRPVPYGLDKKNCEAPAPVPPPPVVPPPLPAPGIHKALGVVYEDIADVFTGLPNGRFDMFGGEQGLEGWTVQLFDANGVVLSIATTDANGNYQFLALANGTYSVCVVGQPGFVRTEPNGDACGGAGWTFSFSGSLEQEFPSNFGMLMQ